MFETSEKSKVNKGNLSVEYCSTDVYSQTGPTVQVDLMSMRIPPVKYAQNHKKVNLSLNFS